MKTPPPPINPTEQKNVLLAGHQIIAVRLPDNHAASAFRTLCRMLRLDYATQLRKVQTHPVIGRSLIIANIETRQGIRAAYVIIAEAIPIWLTSIHPSKVAPEARELLIECQQTAAETIRRAFFPEGKEAPKFTPPLKQPQPMPLPDLPLDELFGSLGKRITATLEQIIQEQQAIKGRLDRDEFRLEVVETKVEALIEQLNTMYARLDATSPLTAEHQGCCGPCSRRSPTRGISR